MNVRTIAMAGLVAAAFLATEVSADVIIMSSGERREGRVEAVQGDPNSILLITGTQELRIPRHLIREIIEQEDWEDYTILGNQLMRSRNYERAVQRFQQALAANPDYEPAQEGMAEVRRLMDQQRDEQARQTTESNASALANARELAEQGRFEQAVNIINQVKSTATEDEQRTAARLVERDVYLAWAFNREDRLDYVGAEAHVQRVLEIDPENERARELRLKIWENDPSRREDVLKAYREQLERNPTDLELNRKLADLLIRMNREEEAIDPLMVVYESGRYRAQNYDRRLFHALERKGTNMHRTGRLDEAIAAYEKLSEIFPNADRTPLVILNYQKRVAELDEEDWEGRAALLDNLVARGLRTMALEEANVILRNDPENERATELLREDAEQRIAEIERAMRDGNFFVARTQAQSLARQSARFPDIAQRASDLFTEANLQAERQQRQQREQAREVVTVGDQYLSEARRYTELYKSADNFNRSGVISYRVEAERFAGRAIEAYQAALEMDPSVGDLVGGMDVNTKLADARYLVQQLNRPTPRLPLPRTGVSPARRAGAQ